MNLTIRQNMSSLEIAELTGKQHKHVLTDIRKMLNDLELNSADFSAQYKDASGKSNSMFELPKRECLILASGYNVILRAKIIDRWAELEAEKQLSPLDFMQMQLDMMKQQDARISAIETKLNDVKAINAPIEHFSIMGYCHNIGKKISLETAKQYGQQCRKLSNELGLVIGKVPDPRFGSVNTYALDVLESIIND